MAARRARHDDEFAPQIEARSLADHAVGLAMALTSAQDEPHGVYADAARWELGLIRERLAVIEAAVAKMPTMKKSAA